MSAAELARATVANLLTRANEAGLVVPGDETAQRVGVGQLLLQFRSGAAGFDEEAAWKAMEEKYKKKKPEPVPKKSDNAKKEEKESSPKKEKKGKKVKREEEEDEEEEEEEEEKPKKKTKKAPAKKKAKKEEEDEEEEEEEKKKAPAKKKAKAKKEEDDEKEGSGSDGEEKKKKKEKLELHNEANGDLCALFKEMGGHFFKVGDRMRGSAYMKVYGVIMNCEEAITSGAQAKKMKGIGDGSAKKIQEFLDTGKIAVLEEIRASEEAVM